MYMCVCIYTSIHGYIVNYSNLVNIKRLIDALPPLLLIQGVMVYFFICLFQKDKFVFKISSSKKL